jgi:hypothetical protein
VLLNSHAVVPNTNNHNCNKILHKKEICEYKFRHSSGNTSNVILHNEEYHHICWGS